MITNYPLYFVFFINFLTVSSGKDNISLSSKMKLFNESFVNIKSFPDINLVVALMTFFFLTAKDLMLADSPSLNFIVILAFLVPLRSKIFSLIVYNFLFFFFFYLFQRYLKHQDLPHFHQIFI